MKVIKKILNNFINLFGFKLSRVNNSTPSYQFKNGHDYSLILIGAHNGKKSIQLVIDALKFGKVCLIEPVPYLFDQLSRTHKKNEQTFLINKCITSTEKSFIDFYSTSMESNKVHHYGDQLGSLDPNHAKKHDKRFQQFVSKIKVPTTTPSKLLSELNCNSIDYLLLDTEGSDAQILLSFPFNLVKPNTICFEHKHIDGTYTVGDNFLSIVKLLNLEGYKIRILDSENAIATLNKTIS